MKRWISKPYGHCWKGFKYAKDAGKTEESQAMEDFSEEQCSVYCFRNKQGTHEQPSQKKKKTVVDHPGNQVLRTKVPKLFKVVILIISAIFLSCGPYVNIFYVKYLTQDSTK